LPSFPGEANRPALSFSEKGVLKTRIVLFSSSRSAVTFPAAKRQGKSPFLSGNTGVYGTFSPFGTTGKKRRNRRFFRQNAQRGAATFSTILSFLHICLRLVDLVNLAKERAKYYKKGRFSP